MKATFKDIEKELWIRMRDEGQIVWTTKEGQEIPIKDMNTSHLINTYNMLLRKAAKEAAEQKEKFFLEEAAFGIDSSDLQL